MNWQCRLYGHQWHHPGEFEVVIVENTVPAYPFECTTCGSEMLLDGNGGRWLDGRDSTTDEVEPELDSAIDRDVVEDPSDHNA